MGFAVDIGTNIAVGVDGDDDCVGDSLVVDEVEVGDVWLTVRAWVDRDVSAFAANLCANSGHVE